MYKLEKFKRRLIRSVAMLLIHEKKPEEEVWEILKEEIGKNCQVLWERMRALTVKKLRRLVAAEDKTALIPKFAQLSETDWLFFDLVIAHEAEDVIGRDDLYAKSTNSKVLTDLFTLVQRFNIEAEKGEKLAEAWIAATILYNTYGNKCSPMLMQRRWYQLKRCTRQRFYDFWFSYRGVPRYWTVAQTLKPNELQQAIAKKYPYIITAPFLSWEELIDSGLVILSDEFERCKSNTNLPKPCDENSPDLLLVEPVIETIDLEEYISDDERSEEEISKGISNDEESLPPQKIKTEPEDIPNDEEFDEEQSIKSHISIEVLSSLEQEESLLGKYDDANGLEINGMSQDITMDGGENEILYSNIINGQKHISQTAITEPIQEDIPVTERDTTSVITSVTATDSLQKEMSKVINEDFQRDISETISESFEEGFPKITNVFGNVDITNDDLINSLPGHTKNLKERPDLSATPMSEDKKVCETINLDDSSDTDDVHIRNESPAPPKDNNEEADVKNISPPPIQDAKTSNTSNDLHEHEKTLKTKQPLFGGLRNYFDFTEDGIELVDDGIEYVEDDELEKKIDCHTPNKIETEDNEDVAEPDEAKFDLKLLMQTSVYTTKLDDMKAFKDNSFQSVTSQSLIDTITIESKPVCSKSFYIPNCKDTDNSVNDEILSEDDNDEIDDTYRVELSSNLFKKPRSRSYNPIKLCKNPDFNTRLKWLTVGFLSSSRNRFLLKICKPMTIDMSKEFESKLLNGTMYLKNSNTTIETKNDGNDNKTASVIPSAMSVQSLIDNMILQSLAVDLKNNEQRQLVCSFDGSLADRSNVSLTDMNKAFVQNQQLLTAEATPVEVQISNLKTLNQLENVTNQKCNTATAALVEKSLSKCNGIELSSQPIISDNPSQISKDTPVNKKVKVVTNTSNLLINAKGTEAETVPVDLDNTTFYTNQLNLIQSRSPCPMRSLFKTNKRGKKKGVIYPIKPIPWRCLPSKAKVSWLENKKYTTEDDALITIDTLHKMLSHIDGSSDLKGPTKSKVENKKGRKLKKLRNIESKPNETVNNDSSFQDKVNLVSDTTPITNDSKKPKITVVFAKHENTFKCQECCWARTRINLKQTKLKKFIFRHTCKRDNCTCCCKNELKNLINDIKTDKALKSACDSIESVVRQTRELIAVQTIEADKPVTETVAVQTLVDLSDSPSDNEMSDLIIPKEDTLTDSNIVSSINVIRKSNDNNQIGEEGTSFYMEINAAPGVAVHNPLLPRPRPPINSKRIDRNIKVSKSVRTINISASATEPDRNDNSKLSKRKISICAKDYINNPRQRLNNQLENNVNTDINRTKQNKYDINSKDRILILNRRQLSKSKTENPIYLGKNKILVTNVKIPSPISDTHKGMEPASILPKGVQLTLAPTGELVCNLLPGTEIDATGLLQLPSIMAAVETHLNLPGSPLSPKVGIPKISTPEMNSEEVLDLCENESEPEKDITMENFQSVSSTSIEEETVNSIDHNNIEHETSTRMIIESQQNKLISKDKVSEEVSSNNKQNIQDNIEIPKENEINLSSQFNENIELPTKPEHNFNESAKTKQGTVGLLENQEEDVTKTTDNDTLSTNRKTLLSDLMEMSGISAEDVAAPAENLLQKHTEEVLPLDPLISQSASNIPITVHSSPNQNKSVINVPVSDPEGKNQMLNLPQLNTITSYAELRYACEMNGSFFKLDYKTGIIVPITVCLKKTTRPLPTISSESVIDLTDEKDDGLEDETDDIIPNERNKRRMMMKAISAKPLKVFKAIHRPNKLQKQKSLLANIKNRDHQKYSLLKSNVKETIGEESILKKYITERHISLVNSNNSMKNICIVNSSDDESPKHKRRYSSNSSDDEPLISKVKRKKLNTDRSEENEMDLVEMHELSDKIGEPDTGVIPLEEEQANECSENDITKDDPDVSTTLSVILDHTDVEEDCILGV